MYYTIYTSIIGKLTIVSDELNIVGLWMENQKHFESTITEKLLRNDSLPVLVLARNWLDEYFKGNNPSISLLPLNPQGSNFRKLVWQLLCEIPYGSVTTYGNLARRISELTGKNMSAQAIGGAVGHNPISIIIPCHRVIGTDRSLTGYAGGIDKKRKLLVLEGVELK